MTDPGLATHEVTIKRKDSAPTRGSAGGLTYGYSTGNRAGLPTKWKCRAMQMSEKQKIDNGLRGNNIAWKFMGEENPHITEADQLSFDFEPGDTRTIKVLTPSRPHSADLHHYRLFGEEDSTES